MKIFLSWSGQRSRAAAEAFCGFIKPVIQAVDPWISTTIDKGARWGAEIAAGLEDAKVGIVFLTKENINANWIHFEAGAISKTKDAHACTFLVDLEPSDIEQPLGQFQHTRDREDDVWSLVQTINGLVGKHNERPLEERTLRALFEVFWPGLSAKLFKARQFHDETRVTRRSDREVLEEVLEIVRHLQGMRDGSSVVAPLNLSGTSLPALTFMNGFNSQGEYISALLAEAKRRSDEHRSNVAPLKVDPESPSAP